MTIPKEEAFEGEHLSDVAAVLVADGALELVGPEVHEHLRTCESCSKRVADEVASSMRADAIMRVIAARAPAHQFPAWLVVLALVLATIGFLPRAGFTIRAALDAFADAPRLLPIAIESVLGLLRTFSGATFTITALASAAVLAILGFAVARQARPPQLT